jgi:hypothetical protein
VVGEAQMTIFFSACLYFASIHFSGWSFKPENEIQASFSLGAARAKEA